MAKIQVKSSCLVKLKSNANPMSILELSPWDLQFISFNPNERGILFHKPQKFDIDHLKASLSRTLDFFPPLAGRIAAVQKDDHTTRFFVDCNNAGVEFTHAVAAGVCVSDILEPIYVPDQISSFFPLNEGTYSKPLLAVQVTELVDGLFIGTAVHPAIVDGTSFWHFFNSWSEITRGFDSISKSPDFSRCFPSDVVNDNFPICLPPLEQHHLQKTAQPPLLERVFHFSKESLSKLKAKANSEAKINKISTFQALSALLWRAIVHCQQVKKLQNEELEFILLVGARARIPLPEFYFGNAVYSDRTAISGEELLQNGIGYVALKINELVRQQTGEAAIKDLEERVMNPRISRNKSSTFVKISSSPRHNVYGGDFGWGKPVAVRSGKARRFDGKTTVFAAAEGGGIDVEVCLAPEKMEAMENDAEFMEAML